MIWAPTAGRWGRRHAQEERGQCAAHGRAQPQQRQERPTARVLGRLGQPVACLTARPQRRALVCHGGPPGSRGDRSFGCGRGASAACAAAPCLWQRLADQVRHEAPADADFDRKRQIWDVFIAHASEDKNAVARALADNQRKLGVTVWMDAFELRIGDSPRRRIDAGLAGSRFGVVVLSRSFFRKGWPQYELDGLVTRFVSGEQSLLPIWHDVTKDEVMAESPPPADKIARSTAQCTIQEIAREIAEVVRLPPHHDRRDS